MKLDARLVVAVACSCKQTLTCEDRVKAQANEPREIGSLLCLSFLALNIFLFSTVASADQWLSIGPAPIQNSPWGNITGRITSIAVDPGNPNHWLIGGADGGVWATLNGGTTWTPLTDDQPSLAIGAIAFAPGSPNVVYAGTGDPTGLVESYTGTGLLKSVDGGTTWQLLAASTFARSSFSEIRVNPTTPTILVATTGQGGAGKGDPRRFPSVPPRGIFKSSDGGATWSRKGPMVSVDTGGRLIGDGTDLEVDPTSFSRMYAGIGTIFGGTTNGLYRSGDVGETWTLISGPWSSMTGGVGRVALAIAPSNPNTLYVAIQDAYDGIGADGKLLGLWRTDTAWATTPSWTPISTAATDGICDGRCSNLLSISVNPSNANTLHLSGIFSWRCTNCGTSPTWTNVINGIHVDVHVEGWAGNRLLAGTDGGLYGSTDGGATWTNHNGNLSITQFDGGCLHPTDPNFVLGGSVDNGYEKWTGASVWGFTPSHVGDGHRCAISSAHPDLEWALGFDRTLDGGISVQWNVQGIDFSQGQVTPNMPVEKCPAIDDIFITANSTVWRTNNFFTAATPSWSANSPPLLDDAISALAFAPQDTTCGTYAFGSEYGTQLRLTSNGGATWVDLDAGNAVPGRYVTDLAFDPTNSNVLYVTLTEFDAYTPGQPGHVFKTTGALTGAPTWSNVSPPVDVGQNTIVLDNCNPNGLYVGSEQGVWKSTNGGGTWSHMGPESGMPNVAVYDLQISPGTGRVAAFTHGRGAFVLDLTRIPVMGIVLSADHSTLSWPSNPRAVSYDVVKGSLRALRLSNGDFTSSLLSCLENDGTDLHAIDTSTPPVAGQGFYYLVRAKDCAGLNATYDSGSVTQTGSRDAEIQASPAACQ